MKKIPVLFEHENNFIVPRLNHRAAWVLTEPSIAHRKYDGTCMLLQRRRFRKDQWFARREIKPRVQIPKDFIECEYDQSTGKRFGWIPVSQGSFYSLWKEAVDLRPYDCDFLDTRSGEYESGTYELIGPKINNNPEGVKRHRLVPHNRAEQLGDIQALELDLAQTVEQVYAELKRMMYYLPVEGVVFKDQKTMTKMAKLRRKDFDYTKEDHHAKLHESQQRQGK